MSLSSGQKKGLLWGGVTLVFASIGLYLSRQYNFLVNAGKKLVNAKVHKLSLTNVDITAYLEWDNKGDLSAEITDQYYNVFVNGMFVSNVSSKESLLIRSNAPTIIPLNINFNPGNVLSVALQNVFSLVSDRNKVVISVRGKFTAKVGVLTLTNFPLSFDMTLAEILSAENNTTKPNVNNPTT